MYNTTQYNKISYTKGRWISSRHAHASIKKQRITKLNIKLELKKIVIILNITKPIPILFLLAMK